MKTLRVLVATLAFLGLGALAIGAMFVYFGPYNVGATKPHSQFVYSLLQTTARRSIQSRAKDIVIPDLSQLGADSRGLSLFNRNCVRCHGAPGIAPDDFAMGLEPGAPPLAQTGRMWDVRELYWTTRHGIKMTAMPAWEFRLSDEDIWAVVAFLRLLPTLSPSEYRRTLEKNGQPVQSDSSNAAEAGHADPERGSLALHQYACNMCHEIPGISGPQALAGPPLGSLAKRPYIAGVLLNTPANMIAWIRHPQSLSPGTAMPDMGVTQQHARDIAAYLYQLE